MSMFAQNAASIARQEAMAGLRPHISQRQLVWRRFRRHKLALLGAAIFGVLVVASVAAPLLTRYQPDAQDLFNILQPPDTTHWLGTDELGRDVLSRLLYGGRTSLLIGIAATLVSVVVGVTLGAISGWLGGVIFLAIVLHKVPEGFTVASLMLASGQSRQKALLAAVWLGAATVAGVLLMGVLHSAVGYALPISAGVTLYVAATDLIPEVNRKPDARMALLVFLGVSLMLLLAKLFRA